ncbi:MFS transporter [Salinisphaera sp. Q1T1-3]|uniref:MFS transporter n=1 Tax=Salinisphaera sp. Q1T1-3 TaxID=2321229 RepID=UPI000E76135A|nr:MFS transporter [Salinisphaera sp. Q1T1-3]RJS93602.1 MFS transporter [Salinisphaera sp. Q1T1-3]
MNAWCERVGMPPQLLLAYIGVVVFMMGDGLEAAWLQNYFVNHGLSGTQAAWVFTAYGLTVALGSWGSGVLTESFGPVATMLGGTLLFLIGTAIFVPALAYEAPYWTLLATYPLRGFAYPMFAYSFLVVIAQVAPRERLGAAVGWFWFCFTGGFFVLGAQYSDLAFSVFALSPIELLATGPIFVVLGAIIAFICFRNTDYDSARAVPGQRSARRALIAGLTIGFENYKVGLGGLARVINTLATYGFMAFMPSFMQQDIGFSQSQWLQIWGMMFIANIVANLTMGLIGDRIGWRSTIMWGGGLVCMLATLGFYYLPLWTQDYDMAVAMAILLGVGLAGFVPLSALMPTLAPEQKGAALSVLNLGAGLSTFVGTAIVSLCFERVGVAGIVWIFAALYAVSIVLVHAMKLDEPADAARSAQPADAAS